MHLNEPASRGVISVICRRHSCIVECEAWLEVVFPPGLPGPLPFPPPPPPLSPLI